MKGYKAKGNEVSNGMKVANLLDFKTGRLACIIQVCSI